MPVSKRTIQGSRWPFSGDSQYFGLGASYFAVLGCSDLYWAQPYYDGDPVASPPQEATKHVVDFSGYLSKFRIKIRGNTLTHKTRYSVLINGVETDLAIVVNPGDDGDFEADATLFERIDTDDEVVGRALLLSAGGITEDFEAGPLEYASEAAHNPGLVEVYMEMHSLDDDDVRNCYKASYYGNVGEYGATRPYSFFPMTGNMGHYNATLTTQEDLGTMEEWETFADLLIANVPIECAVRAGGTYTYLQATWGAAGHRGTMLFLATHDTPVFNGVIGWNSLYDSNAYPSVFSLPHYDSGYYDTHTEMVVNRTASRSIAAGEFVSFLNIDTGIGAGSGNTLWTYGVNWKGDPDVDLVEHYCSERPADSYDRETGFDFIGVRSGVRYTEWVSSPIGSVFWELRKDVGEGETLRPGDNEVTPTFEMRLRNLRAYLDINVTATTIRVGVLVDGVEDTSYFIDCTEPGWYENADAVAVVGADHSWCWRAKAPEAGPGDTYYAHISTMALSYSHETPTDSLRILPEPDPITPEPCVTHRARCWTIVRTDGETFMFTEHDEDIVNDSGVFKACGGFIGGASELGAVLAEVGNQEISGFMSATGISHIDILAGKFVGAYVEVWLRPWGPWSASELPIQIGYGVLGDLSTDGDGFTMEALSPSAQLNHQSMLSMLTKNCRFTFGDYRCTVAVESMRVNGEVTTKATADGYVLTRRRGFYDSARTEPDDWFVGGQLEFLTGANAGWISEVRSFRDNQFLLWEPCINQIEVGDTYTVLPGCDKTFDTCTNVFQNGINFGGFPVVPGGDAISEFPNVKG